MKPMVNIDISIPPDDIITHKSSHEYDLDSYTPLSYPYNDPLPRDFLNQPLLNPNNDEVQGSHSS